MGDSLPIQTTSLQQNTCMACPIWLPAENDRPMSQDSWVNLWNEFVKASDWKECQNKAINSFTDSRNAALVISRDHVRESHHHRLVTPSLSSSKAWSTLSNARKKNGYFMPLAFCCWPGDCFTNQLRPFLSMFAVNVTNLSKRIKNRRARARTG